MDKKTLRLVHAEARRRAVAYVEAAPDNYVVTISEPTRSLEQNSALHSMLSDIAAQVDWAGKKRDAEVWKRLLTAAWLRARGESIEILPALDGYGVDVVFRRTSTLTKSEFSELFEFINSWASEHGIELKTYA